ncbi:MAG: T9SS C-terminal target domain-containing protein [Candidatus Neomarinimicrobiota bacterium]|nr:MAG: T9SS C-terminal target domain-containing protein [Candidatus Neomarinimicrobiota bacterium]
MKTLAKLLLILIPVWGWCQTDTTAVFVGMSTLFTIDGTDPVVDWISPDGGEGYASGATITGNWTATDENLATDPVSIFIAVSPGGKFDPVVTNMSNIGSMMFVLPAVNTAFARIKLSVVDAFGNAGVDFSQDYFTIGQAGGYQDTTAVWIGTTPTLVLDGIDPLVDLINPVGGETFASGGSITVDWTATDPSLAARPLSIALATAPGRPFRLLADTLDNAPPVSLFLPAIDSAFCRLRVTATDSFGNRGLAATSDYFRIGSGGGLPVDTTVTVADSTPTLTVDSQDPFVDLLSPDGQEAILEGTGVSVTWVAADDSLVPNPIDISLATSIGGLFEPQVTATGNDGNESFLAPNVVTDFARVRVAARDAFGNEGRDESQDYFKIFQTGTGAIAGFVRATGSAEGWLYIGLWFPGSNPDSQPADVTRDSMYVTLAPGDSIPYSFANLLPGLYTVRVFLDQTGSPTVGPDYCDGALDYSGDSTGIPVVVNTVTHKVDIELIRCPRLYPLAPVWVSARPRYGSVELIWKADPEAVTYQIYRDTVPNPTQLLAQTSTLDTVFLDTSVESGSSYYYRLSSINTYGNEGDFSSDMLVWYHPVVSYWQGSSASGTWIDQSGLNHDGTLINAVDSVVNGDSGLWFNGQNAYVAVPDHPDLNPPEITVEAIIYPAAWGGNNRILQKGLGDNQYLLESEGDHLEFMVNNQSYSVMIPLPPTDEWMHVAGVYDGDSARIYVNYQERNRLYVGQPLAVTSDPLYIGTKQPASPGIDFFHGAIQAVRIANVVVPPDHFLRFDPAPQTPRGFQGTAGDRRVQLTWRANPEPDLAVYRLYRSTENGLFPWLTDVSPADTAYLDTTVTNGSFYRYALQAVDTLQHGSHWVYADSLHPNRAPLWSGPADTSFFEDDTLILDFAPWIWDDSDPDSTLQVTLSGGNQIHSDQTGSFRFRFWMLPDQFGATEAFSIRVSDPWGAVTDAVLTLSVLPVNDAPVITSATQVQAVEDVELVYHMSATDVDLDPVQFQVLHLPSWLIRDGLQILGTPREGDLDTSFTLIASDSQLADTARVDITVQPVNDPPVYTGGLQAGATEDIPFVYYPRAADPEDSTITFSYAYGPQWLSFETDSLVGTPREGDLDTVFALHFTDGDISDSVEIALTVQPVNDPPRITSPATFTFTEHIPDTFQLAAIDPDDSTLFWSLWQAPPWAWVSHDTLFGTPEEGDSDITAVLVVSDGDLTDTLLVWLQVIPVNDPPVLTSPTETYATEDIHYIYVATWQDPEHQPVDVVLYNHPPWATVHGDTLEGTPREGDTNTSFFVRLTDDTLVVQWTVYIHVNPVNDPPVLTNPDTLEVVYNQFFSYHIQAYDVEDSTLTFQYPVLPSWLSSAADSIFGLPTLLNSDTVVHVFVSDGQLMDHQWINLHLVQPDVTPLVTMDTLEGEYHGMIPFTIRVDSSLQVQFSDFQFDYSLDGASWTPATVLDPTGTGGYSDSIPVTWVSQGNLHDVDRYPVWFRSALDPQDVARYSIVGPLRVDNYVGEIHIQNVWDYQTVSNEFIIPFTIVDTTGDLHTVQATYLFPGGDETPYPCTSPDTGRTYSSSSYTGTFTWYTQFDLVNLDTIVILSLTTSDGWETSVADGAFLHVDNQVLPLLAAEIPPEIGWADTLQLQFTHALDSTTIAGGIVVSSRQHQESGFVTTLSPGGYTVGIFPDTGGWTSLDSVTVTLNPALKDQWGNPFDGNGNGDPDGAADILSVSTRILPLGDFNRDGQINFPDVVRFQRAWWIGSWLAAGDLGPADGTVPYVKPLWDHRIDFEDLMVFVLMWNWWDSQTGTLTKPLLTSSSPGGNGFDLGVHHPERKPGDPLDVTELWLTADDFPPVAAVEGVLQFPAEALTFDGVVTSSVPEGWITWKHAAPGELRFLLADFRPDPDPDSPPALRFRFRVARDVPVPVGWEIHSAGYEGADYPAVIGSKVIQPLPDLPADYALQPNYPNPFNPLTQIRYDLPQDDYVQLTVYNVQGKPVRTLVKQEEVAGRHRVQWDGRDEEGREVASGMYLVSMTTSSWSAVRKIMLLK